MRCTCWLPCARTGSDARAVDAGRARARARRLRRTNCRRAAQAARASPMRWRSPRRPTRSPRPTPQATWCCSCRASPRRSGARWSRRCRWVARCWAGPWRRRRIARGNCSPSGAVAPFDAVGAGDTRAHCWRSRPRLPATMPYTLHAMQRATLELYGTRLPADRHSTRRAHAHCRAGLALGAVPGCWPSSRCGLPRAMPKACWCWARWRHRAHVADGAFPWRHAPCSASPAWALTSVLFFAYWLPEAVVRVRCDRPGARLARGRRRPALPAVPVAGGLGGGQRAGGRRITFGGLGADHRRYGPLDAPGAGHPRHQPVVLGHRPRSSS